MFKSQGLFSSLPCPSSPCPLQNCVFSHPSSTTASAAPEQNSLVAPESADRSSPADERRSRKRRFIEVYRPSHDSQNSENSPNLQPSSPEPTMVQTMLRTNHRAPDFIQYKRPIANKSVVLATTKHARSDDKFTKTFNASAQVFLPTKPATTPKLVPRLDPQVHKSISVPVRTIPLNLFCKEYQRIYSSLPNSHILAVRDAVKEEYEFAKSSSSAHIYKVTWSQQYAHLQSRRPVTTEEETGSLSELYMRQVDAERKIRWAAPLTWEEISPLVPSKEELARWKFITGTPSIKPFNQGVLVACHRCTTMFTPSTRTQYPCIAHWGKQIGSSTSDGANSKDGRIWSCCQASVGSRGCTIHPCHVRKVSHPGELGSIRAFNELDSFIPGQHHSVVSLDCEMAYTLNGMELVRLTVLDAHDRQLFDVLVRPESEITDFNTRFSGITKEMFESGTVVSFDEAIELMKFHVSRTTIIIGHGLDNDLSTLRLIHHAVVDTSLLYPHPRGRPYRLALKDLVKRETGLDVQTAGAEGHSSIEDAAAASLLVRKCARPDSFPGIAKVVIGGEDTR
jgi:RNA exonuclease 1